VIAVLLASLLLANISVAHTGESERAPAVMQSPAWTLTLPTDQCLNLNHNNCQWSSPVLADITGDSFLEIIVATNKGHVLAIDRTGAVLWNTDVAPAFGMVAGTHEIASSPAVADIDADGKMEVVVGAGTLRAEVCTQGGVIVLEHDGTVKENWPVLADDWDIPPAGCRDTVYSTPALGDLDRDGGLEIISGGFDKRIDVWRHDASPYPGFPPDSYLTRYHPDWPELRNRLGDTIWSSPAVALIDGDNMLDVLIGTDEGLYEGSNWYCPYRYPDDIYFDYCGGSLYGLTGSGALLEGNFPRHIHETVQSTPAVADINHDGRGEIFVGTGTYYYRNSPDRPTLGFRVFGWDARGNDLPGWEGGKQVQGTVPASPSVGDITGDGEPEIVVATSAPEKRLYAWHHNGTLVPGFPMTPRDYMGQTLSNYDVGTGFILADYDGDGAMEIFFNQAWGVTIVDGDGTQLTAAAPDQAKPIYLTGGTLLNNPAVADIDGDGRLEMVVYNSKLYLWELPDSGPEADWPMFKQNSLRNGSTMAGDLTVVPGALASMVEQGGDRTVFLWLRAPGTGSFDYEVVASHPEYFRLPPAGSSTGSIELVELTILASRLPAGSADLGSLEIRATAGDRQLENTSPPVSVQMNVVEEMYQLALPLISR